ncbi:spexin prohormone 2 [Austrofundulus limnaeus]|uniref:Spexin prohormone 2 n=1 Tax=Austrofundulus limnaeus TaxID=52670 RepID=A0A2I4BDA4_AUSLI|nr:PREDICTED: uncharacterized protein LOC106518852 [Austrofundulus limnaeus]
MMTSQSYTQAAQPGQGTDRDGGSTQVPVRVDPCSEMNLSEQGPIPLQQIIPPEMLDPYSFRSEHPCQPSQLMYPDFPVETHPSQYQVLNRVLPPGPPTCSQLSSASWFTDEPVCSGAMAGLHKHDVIDHQQFLEGPPEVTPPVTQTMMYNVTEGGQLVLVNPCEPGSMLHAVRYVEDHQNCGKTPGKESVLETPSQFPQYQHRARCFDECGDHADIFQPPVSAERSVGSFFQLKSRKPCHCTKSQCLKLYCECFANGLMCINCNCSNCYNNTSHEMMRQEAVKSCLDRNPKAFTPKIAAGRSGTAKGRHNKGCNCKRSGCLKNYCECYEASIMCTSSCKCVGCWNCEDNSMMEAKKMTGQVNERRPASVLTREVLETVCACLLAQAEESERKGQTPAVAQHMILQEFGCCLSEIAKALLK